MTDLCAHRSRIDEPEHVQAIHFKHVIVREGNLVYRSSFAKEGACLAKEAEKPRSGKKLRGKSGTCVGLAFALALALELFQLVPNRAGPVENECPE